MPLSKFRRQIPNSFIRYLETPRNFLLLIRDWSSTYDDPDEFYSFYATRTHKSTNWSNADYDKLVEQARTEKTAGQRMAIYRRIEKLLVDKEVAVLPLFYKADATLVGPRVQGFDAKNPQPCLARELSYGPSPR